MSERTAGVVSVVVVNYRGVADTLACLTALTELDYPAESVEIICVDNASGDSSMERLRAEAPPRVQVVESPVNGGFTGGCNLGATHGTGEFVAFINNDARPDPAWLREAIGVLESDASIACVASKVLDWEGRDVDFVDASLTWYGMGYKPGAGAPYDGTREQPADVLFPTGSAMVVRADVFAAVGGFDERYFMFYEDVDLGWRLNLLGHRVRYVPTSVVFHKHHQSMKDYGAYSEWFLLERNALMTMYKNLSEASLQRLLGPALALSVRRSLAIGGADTAPLDLQRGLGGDRSESITVSKRSLAGPYAIDSFVEHLPSLAETRAQLQAERVVSDEAVKRLFGNVLEPAIPNERYLAGHQSLVDAFHVADWVSAGSKVLVVTADPLTAKMAGPAIRAFHIADELATEHDVHLVSTTSCTISADRFSCSATTIGGLRAEVGWADIVVFQGFLLTHAPWLAKSDKILVPDLYDPIHLEQLEQTRGDVLPTRARDIASTTGALNAQLERGDYFICASDKQRHFWLGQLAALGRLNPSTYDRDPSLERLLGVVPFGLASEPPLQTSRPIKGGSVPGFGPADKIVLWAGGIYNWFDPLTLLHSMAQLGGKHDDVRLFFLGTQHPNPQVPQMRMVSQARELSDSLGLTGNRVFFNDGWVPYEQRQNYLLDADVGVSTHFAHIETTFSFRTRILDYLWAGLPMVVTEGDAFADLVLQHELGLTVPEQDVDALTEALERALYDEAFIQRCRTNVAVVAQQFTWPVVMEPLLQFCRSATRAPDAEITVGGGFGGPASSKLRRDLALARTYLREGGPRELVRRASGRLRGGATPG